MLSAKGSVLYAEEYEQRIPLLLSEHPGGKVHSIFQNGVNVQMGKHLFFIGTTKNGQLPFGIHLSHQHLQELLGTINNNCSVSWHSAKRELEFGEGVPAVCLAGAVPFDWQISRKMFTDDELMDNLAMLISILLIEPRITGLGTEIESFLAAYLEGSPASGINEQHIYELLSLLESSDREKIETELRFFIGRGQGLTPSGDDHLVGLLAIHAATGILSTPFVETVKGLVLNESLTTDIGREYLLYALEGKFSSTVAETASALTEKTDIYMLKPLLSELLDMGHSSGTDTVFGMLLGLLALRRKQEWQKK
ncbi:DUF2877 domain-containing protein [Sporosarcina aquimarina]|uniref:DUF2877 domain-containing protein n=1 Tax=Sporosarcina aquimarina TaxID=114975 RepID=UPI00203FE80D|nr:DUF2877 domain-containing protein [Sporosarcina aquimarina]